MSKYLHFGTPTMSLDAKNAYAIANDSVYWVDGTNGTDGNTGRTPKKAWRSIQTAITRSQAGGVIYILPKKYVALATDPTSYEETLIIPNSKPNLSLIGVGSGQTQGGLPQLKDGTSTEPIISVQAPGLLIKGLGLNGAGNTGGLIEMVDDGGTANVVIGTTIEDCHLKNAKSSGAAATGGAIQWTADGGAWQVRITRNVFYNCRAGVVLIGTAQTRPQDVVIQDNVFHSSANTTIDADIYLSGGSGINGLTIDGNKFSTVDVPAYASSPSAARYLDLTGCTNGMLSNNTFACITNVSATEKTFGATGTGAKIPTTVRMANNYGEPSSAGTNETGEIFRT